MTVDDIIKKLEQASSIPEAFFSNGLDASNEVIASIASTTTKFTRGELVQKVSSLIGYLRKRGVKEGSKVAILSNTRLEWIIADLAILSLGGVTASVYQSLPAAEVGFILWDSESTIVFAENAEQVEKLKYVQSNEIPCPQFEGKGDLATFRAVVNEIITFEVVEGYTSIGEIFSSNEVRGDLPLLSRDSIASFVYTSGTTGAPKGVVQTHGNHLANVRQALQGELFEPDSAIFLMLPLAHSFARLMAYISMTTGVVIVLPRVASTQNSRQDPTMALQDMSRSGATIVPLVPRILEKVKEGLEVKASKKTLGSRIIRWLLPSGGKGGCFTKLFGAMIRKAVFGENFSYALSGGAKLDPGVNNFFKALGIEVLEGYGLTETCVATNCNRRGRNSIGTVGPLLAQDIEICIASDGEILFKGPNITKEYWKRPKATSEAWDSDGWFHTGDLGALDNDGALKITGRKKELIVTAGGKKIVPEGIEFKLKSSPYISNAVLCGDGKPYCVALITLQRTVIEEQFGNGEHGILGAMKAVQSHFDEVNAGLPSFETIKKFRVLEVEFTIDNGLLTPTLKLKRGEVAKRFKDILEELYRA
jgi:long-chain acyl-CoA synthetase